MKKIRSRRTCRACGRKHFIAASYSRYELLENVKKRLKDESSQCQNCGHITGQPQLFASHPPTKGKTTPGQDDAKWYKRSG